jgi:TolB-like protein/Tfp pilus assembly protein PilF
VPNRLVVTILLAIAASAPLGAQCPDGTPPPCSGSRIGTNAVAVLRFMNLGRDTAYAYLGDGLSSEIASRLTTVTRIDVRSPGVVWHAQAGGGDPQTLGRRLRVRYVVEGDYQRGGDRVRVAVRLVSVATGAQRWSQVYTRPMTDLLAVQEEIADGVARSIAGTLDPRERARLAAGPTRDPVAYDHLLRGTFELLQRGADQLERAIHEFEAALRADSSTARAWALAGYAYALSSARQTPVFGLPRDSLRARALRLSRRSLALDSTISDGWMALGYAMFEASGFDPASSRAYYRRALSLDSNNAEAWHELAVGESFAGKTALALEAFRRALAIDPARAVTYELMGRELLRSHRFAEALEAYDSAISMNPRIVLSFRDRARARLQLHDIAGARADLAHLDGEPRILIEGLIAAASGDSAAARAAAASTSGPTRAKILSMLGDRAAALDALAAARDSTQQMSFWFDMRSPELDAIRNDPRFPRPR